MISENAVLVTGGAGFAGSNYVHFLIRRKRVCVINLDALTDAGHLETLVDIDRDPEHHFVLGSIGDRSLVEYLLTRYQPRAVVNFAAQTPIGRSAGSPERFIRTNVVGTSKLLEATRKYWESLRGRKRDGFRFLQISCDVVYGCPNGGEQFTEESPHRPDSLYAASKASSDHLVRCYHRSYGLPVLTVRCSYLYGPYQFPENLIPSVIRRADQGRPVPVYSGGETVRDWLYVDDLCRAVDRVLEHGRPGEVYHAGGGSGRKDIELVTQLCGILDELRAGASRCPHSNLIEIFEQDSCRDYRYAMDCRKIHREIGWSPVESFESGILKTVKWYLANQNWCNKVLEGFHSKNRSPKENLDIDEVLS